MPRRGVVALAITSIALFLLLSFKTPSPPTIAGAGAGGGPVAFGQGAAAPPSAVPAATPDPGQGAGSGARTSTTATQPATHPAPGAPGPAVPTHAPAGASGPVTGPVVTTPYGDVQVQVTISGGKIVDVQALQLPSDRRRSQMISQYAGPVLRQEALQAQSASIDLISGATYTSEGYAQSLQAALDQAHA